MIKYPEGALVRVKQICTDNKTGRAGLLPICPGTWYGWVRQGKVPPGRLLGGRTRVWPIEVVRSVGEGAQ